MSGALGRIVIISSAAALTVSKTGIQALYQR